MALTLDNDDHNAHTCPPLSPSCSFRDDSIVDGWIELRDDTGTSAAGKIVFTTNDHIFEGEDGSRTSRARARSRSRYLL